MAVLFCCNIILLMADNYLEKKMEQHKVRAAVAAEAKRRTLLSLLEHSVTDGAFDAYLVREDQIMRIIGAAARLAPALPFQFKFVVGDGAVALRSSHAGIVKSSAYIAVCYSGAMEVDYLLLGRVVQVMLLQAAEMGLSSAFVSKEALSLVGEVLSLPSVPQVMLAFGRSAEPRLSFESMPCDFSADDYIIR